MIAAWMVYASLLGALFGLAALGLERAARALRVTWLPRRVIWTLAILATLLLPLVFASRRPTSAAPAASTAARPEAGVVARVASPTLIAGPSAKSSGAPAPAVPPPHWMRAFIPAVPSTPRLDRALIVAWLAGAAITLACLARSSAALARRRRTWSRREVHGVSVLLAEDFGPAVVGAFRPSIVLPAWTLASDETSLDFILRHESEHRRARDTLLLALCGCAAAFCSWNAALWWQLARLRLATEIDCDARVLARGGDARAYATVLIGAGERMLGAARFVPAFVERSSLLERRILAMSAARAPRRLFSAGILAAAAALCVAIACSAPAPRGATAGAVPAPAQFTRNAIAQQQYYPRIVRIDTVDAAGTEWLRAALARYYPGALAGDTSLAFVSFYLSSDGFIRGAAVRKNADVGADTNGVSFLPAFTTGDIDAPPSDASRAALERASFKADLDTMFASQNPTRSVLGSRIILPRTFNYDTLNASPEDPFLGADPHIFDRVDAVYLKPGMVGPAGVHVNLLTLLPGRGTPADFAHHLEFRKLRAAPPSSHAPEPSINTLGDLPSGGWAVTPELWATLQHKPVILVDGAVRTFNDLMALAGHADTVESVRRLTPVQAAKLTRDTAAAYGAIVVTTKGHR